jgi:hypothetical protein
MIIIIIMTDTDTVTEFRPNNIALTPTSTPTNNIPEIDESFKVTDIEGISKNINIIIQIITQHDEKSPYIFKGSKYTFDDMLFKTLKTINSDVEEQLKLLPKITSIKLTNDGTYIYISVDDFNNICSLYNLYTITTYKIVNKYLDILLTDLNLLDKYNTSLALSLYIYKYIDSTNFLIISMLNTNDPNDNISKLVGIDNMDLFMKNIQSNGYNFNNVESYYSFITLMMLYDLLKTNTDYSLSILEDHLSFKIKFMCKIGGVKISPDCTKKCVSEAQYAYSESDEYKINYITQFNKDYTNKFNTEYKIQFDKDYINRFNMDFPTKCDNKIKNEKVSILLGKKSNYSGIMFAFVIIILIIVLIVLFMKKK